MFWIKIALSALVIGASSELARRQAWAGALLVSLPLTSILALSWLYLDTRDTAQVALFSDSVFWAVLPSLLLFLVLSQLLRRGLGFPLSLGLSCTVMFLGYWGYVWTIKRFFHIDV